VIYTPESGYLGTDSFAYTAIDGLGGSNMANVVVSVQSSSNFVEDGELNSSLAAPSGKYDQNLAGTGWNMGQRRSWQWDPFEHHLSMIVDGTDNLLVQVIADNATTTGTKPVSFRVYSTSASDTLHFRVFGINGSFTDLFRTEAGPSGATVLYDSGNAAGGAAEWTDVAGTADFGAGYQYVIVHIWGDNIDRDAGDELCLDDVYVGK
jgi:hypothetical protein